MWQEERHQRIRAMLDTFERVTTDRIAAELNVSRETVRRDIVELEARGELKRVHGGVVAIDADAEPPLAVRATVRVKEKRAIAKAVLPLLRAGQTVFIDAGSTTSILAEELAAAAAGLSVVTNSWQVASTIAASVGSRDRRTHAYLLGGAVDATLSATFGESTIGEICRRHADLAILSPVGVDARYGATSFDAREAEIARAMSANADRTIILADHSKWDVVSRIAFCGPATIDTLVGDSSVAATPAYASLSKVFGNIVLG